MGREIDVQSESGRILDRLVRIVAKARARYVEQRAKHYPEHVRQFCGAEMFRVRSTALCRLEDRAKHRIVLHSTGEKIFSFSDSHLGLGCYACASFRFANVRHALTHCFSVTEEGSLGEGAGRTRTAAEMDAHMRQVYGSERKQPGYLPPDNDACLDLDAEADPGHAHGHLPDPAVLGGGGGGGARPLLLQQRTEAGWRMARRHRPPEYTPVLPAGSQA